MITFTVPGDPVPFARAGAHGKRRFTPKKQSDFMGAVRMYAAQAMQGRAPLSGPICLEVRASYLIPASWSKKQRAAAVWKSSKPDADNIVKIVKDALNTVAFVDDAQVAVLRVEKVYGDVAGLNVTIRELASQPAARFGLGPIGEAA